MAEKLVILSRAFRGEGPRWWRRLNKHILTATTQHHRHDALWHLHHQRPTAISASNSKQFPLPTSAISLTIK